MSLPPCLEHTPAVPARASVIWMHGLGAGYADFLPVLPHLRTEAVRYVFPQAPSIPVTVNGGYVMPAWYDIRTTTFSAGSGGSEREDPDGVRRSARAIGALIAREGERGLPPSRVVLAGFSQGAAMALHVGLRHPEPLAGLLVLSGYLVMPATLDAEAHPANAATPLLACHGRHDDVVPLAMGRAAWDRVRGGREAEWQEYPMGHELCLEQLEHLGAWLRGVIG